MGIRYEPLYDNLVVKRGKLETMSSGGIVLPGEEQKKAAMGTVLAVGPGWRGPDGKLHPCRVKEGDTIYFSTYAGQELKVMGETVLVVSESEVKIILRETPLADPPKDP